eukprot:CAMPEP_0174723088 /NCGR_PEP_ID=MMETSP1094-20130205/40038_1 /TAXON_ID=156173 /ORGANISM="Chrysochromulina brevifilum, Strain UTEX LB 985" /LENGTH=72 /DNA_ID=CAMNT_0015924071 /DNA_START=580 /DNA_END=798 /DNA_ORIENTATION=-
MAHKVLESITWRHRDVINHDYALACCVRSHPSHVPLGPLESMIAVDEYEVARRIHPARCQRVPRVSSVEHDT